ncbi:hypothetical protein [Cetobacterium sp.]|uniref:hypothetical protein n=1 Tax=Cetobacterium sp. TaxID=2071632 RepID=UPI0025BE5C34|nr:hypothetical protein [Cetobacterium sp.]
MKEYLVIRVLGEDSIYLQRPKIYNNIEVGNFDRLRANEKEILYKSLESFNEYLKENEIKDITRQIVTIIVKAENIKEADEISEKLILELLDLIDFVSIGLGNTTIMKAGYIKDLEEDQYYYRSDLSLKYPLSMLATNNEMVWNVDSIHINLIINENNEFFKEIQKWSHWRRILKSENNPHIKLLMYWFALEGIIKVNEEDQIISKIMRIIGFVQGTLGRDINRELAKSITNQENYKEKRTKINNMLEKIRIKRNDTVHQSMQTYLNITSELQKELSLLEFINETLNAFLHKALEKNVSSKKEFWDEFPKIFEEIYMEKYRIDDDVILTEYYHFDKISYIKSE